MYSALISLSGLFTGMSSLLLANGLFGTLTALRMSMADFNPTTIGIVVSCHSIGFAMGCLRSQALIDKIGHIRTFAATAAIIAVCTLLLPMHVHWASWIPLRLIIGFASAIVFTVSDSWIAGSVPKESKGRIFSIYMVLNKGSFGLGQLLLLTGDPAGDRLFILAAILYTASLIPIALAPASVPAEIGGERASIRELFRLSPVSIVGAVVAGLCNAPLIGLGPVFALDHGLSVSEISYFMTAFLFGSLALQIPIGRLSDKFDRRTVLMGVALGVIAASLTMSAFGDGGLRVLLPLSFLIGGLSATVYPILVTHANDYVASSKTVALMAGLLLAFGVGASGGPFMASLVMAQLGPGGLFIYTAIIYTMLVAYIAYRMTRRAPVPEDEQTSFVAQPQTSIVSPVASVMDPRTEEPER